MLCCLLLWFIGVTAGEDLWLPPSFERLYGTFWYYESKSAERLLSYNPFGGPMGPVSKVHGVLSNKDSLSTSGGDAATKDDSYSL